MKILFHCLIKTYDAERQYIIYAHSNNKHEAEKQHTKKGGKIFLSYGLPHYSLLWGTLYLQRPWMCFSMHSRQSCFMFSTDCLSCFFSQGQYMQLSASNGHSQISLHSSCQPLINYYESCSIKIKQTPGNYEWDEHTEKPNSNTAFYKPGYFKVLKITRNLII